MKLLIVEDDRLLSNALARSLRDAYAVDQAFDGEEGLFYAAQDVSPASCSPDASPSTATCSSTDEANPWKAASRRCSTVRATR